MKLSNTASAASAARSSSITATSVYRPTVVTATVRRLADEGIEDPVRFHVGRAVENGTSRMVSRQEARTGRRGEGLAGRALALGTACAREGRIPALCAAAHRRPLCARARCAMHSTSFKDPHERT